MKTTSRPTPVLRTGYCYEFNGTGDWRLADPEDWETVVHGADGTEMPVGEQRIDGVVCVVFACRDGLFRAANRVNTQ